MDDLEIREFLAEREIQRKRHQQEMELVDRLRENTPRVSPTWDKSIEAVKFNDISKEILRFGLQLFSAPFPDVWNSLYEPDLYEASTLWDESHCSRKIALVITAWEKGKALTPPLFVKHGSKSLGLVADGKHRLTVARYMTCNELPFMVPKNDADWVIESIPSAVLELEIQ